MSLQLHSADLLAQQIHQLNAQAKAILFASHEEAQQLAERAYALAQHELFVTPYHAGILESQSILCRCHNQRAEYLQAIELGESIIRRCEEYSLTYLWAETSGMVGYAYSRTGQFVEGFRLFLQQEQLSIQYGYRALEARSYLGRGLIYLFIGNIHESIRLKMLCLDIFRELNDRHGMLLTYNNLSYDHNEVAQYEQALAYGLEAFGTDGEKDIAHIQGLAATNIGCAYVGLNAFTEGALYLQKAFAIAEATHDSYLTMLAHFELGRLAYLRGDAEGAIPSLQTALAAAVNQKQKLYEYKAHHILAKVYTQLNELAAALTHFTQFHEIREEVLSLQNTARIGVLEVEHAVDQSRREAEHSKKLAQELEQQVHARTADLQAAFAREQDLSQQLEIAFSRQSELQQLKTNIITTASHEFRTPLAIISLSAELLFKQHERLAPEKRLHHWNRIREQTLYMTDMLQDVLTVNTATDIEPQYADYCFEDFCRQLQATLIEAIQQAQLIQFHFSPSSQRVHSDFDLVNRILFNLTVNAIKFSDAVAPVSITCTHNEHDLLIQVADQGIGIPAAELTRIFERFYRASNVDTRRGLGLGLSIVQKLVQVLHGTVYPESSGPNLGSTFYVTLPLLPVQD